MTDEHEQAEQGSGEQADAGPGAAGAGAESPRDAEQAGAGGGEPRGVEELAELLAEARRNADENWDKLVRARAELDNLRKRHERELENAHKFAIDRFVAELLPVRDSLELGLSAAQGEDANLEKLREGKELTLKLLTDVLAKFGIEEVDPQGQPFNPELHQAMSMQPRDDVPPSTVVNVVQKGYTLNGRLVRPAMVIVSSSATRAGEG
ncbi:MAG: nucleotide exchange factor GrpE [Chromatiales bacterium]|jgi:molecular chaperone GrpE